MDELHKSQLEVEGKYTAERFADEIALMSVENVRRYLRRGPVHYPDRWKDLGVAAYRVGKRDWVIGLGAGPDELAAGYAVRTLPPATADALQELRELASVLEQRLPIAEVALTCEERLPIHEVVTQVKQFIKEAPPPDKLLAEIVRTFIRK
ncbi:hypothetical protein ES703_120548 [subsurface metagenome]